MTNRVVLLSLAAAACSFGASWDIVASAGIGLNESTPILREVLPFGSRGVAAGVNVGFQFADLGVAKVELEVPFVATAADRIEIARNFIDGSAWSLYLTPGARFRAGNDRASVFGSFGAGAVREMGLNIASIVSLPDSSHFALGYGGGADLRLIGPLKVRGEIRNFSVKAPGGWSNRPFFLAGLGLQF
jgi:opacity protein-like surface antigen